LNQLLTGVDAISGLILFDGLNILNLRQVVPKGGQRVGRPLRQILIHAV
jgi:hypothetical protein